MRTPFIFTIAILICVASIADTQMLREPSVAEVESVRLEIEQPLHKNLLQIRVRDYAAANHSKEEVSCQIYYVHDDGKESKEADFSLKRSTGETYSGVYPAADHVHGSVVKVVYKSTGLRLPISTWCTFAFH